MAQTRTPLSRVFMTTAALSLMAACDKPFDFDLRNLGDGFSTADAVTNLPDRPRPDNRGVISYPNYQVVVAQRDDTMRTIAARLGLNAEELARYNGIGPDVGLRRDELVALPSRVSEPSPATGAATTGPIQPLDVISVATTALDNAGPQAPVSNTSAPAAATQPPEGTEPIRHQVARGETVYSVSRLYNVPVRSIAEWNGLGPDLEVREGQFLLVPHNGVSAPIVSPIIQDPGVGSVTPVPPSATTPLPNETPSVTPPAVEVPATPDIGPTTTATTGTATLIYPVQGSIIRAYAPGRNEGIDIGVSAGTSVKAAASGTVAAVTTDTNGVAIVVIKHANNLLTVYTNLENLSVEKNDTVTRGQTIASVRSGDPSFLHFEVRRGLQSADPADFLP